MDGYELLTTAIIVRAAKDYKVVLKRCLYFPKDKQWQSERKKLEQFFQSEWYKMLTNLDSGILMNKIKEEVEYESKRLLRSSI